MANNALALRMRYKKLSAEELQAIANDSKSSETEVKIANEFLAKMGVTAEEGVKKVAAKAKKAVETKEAEEEAVTKKATPKKAAKKAVTKKATPKKAAKKADAETQEESVEKAAKSQVVEYESDEQLTPEEKARLAKAEKEFDERQKSRKTPSKSDKAMKPATKEKKEKGAPRETKRQNLDESKEVPGLKIGSKVTLQDGGEVGEITRVYVSGDGKEKCMVKFGDNKPIKKRVTAVTLADEAPKKAPAKKKK